MRRTEGDTISPVQMVQRTPSFRTADPYRDVDVVDARAPRFNQAVVALATILTLVTDQWWIAGLMGLQLAICLAFGR
ncbi:MAG TPA: DUF4395 family protein, partial [Actinomycetota bacterium]|nr:DUF4395 family protein [Actinomycetota bacterium]